MLDEMGVARLREDTRSTVRRDACPTQRFWSSQRRMSRARGSSGRDGGVLGSARALWRRRRGRGRQDRRWIDGPKHPSRMPRAYPVSERCSSKGLRDSGNRARHQSILCVRLRDVKSRIETAWKPRCSVQQGNLEVEQCRDGLQRQGRSEKNRTCSQRGEPLNMGVTFLDGFCSYRRDLSFTLQDAPFRMMGEIS